MMTGCGNRHWFTSRVLRLSLVCSVLLLTPAHAAYYDDGNDRQSLKELRQRPADTLSVEENAILQAANRTGILRSEECGGGISANALLVQVNGRNAVLTSAHHFSNPRHQCMLEQLETLFYYPDMSYYDAAAGDQIPTLMDAVGLDLEASFNLDTIIAPTIGAGKDWVVFQLVRTTSDEIAPDGRVRGFFRYDTKIGTRERSLRQAYPGYILGIDDRYAQENGGMAWSYQTCAFHEDTFAVRHSCDTSPGSSGSLLGVLDGDEIRITGIHNFHGLTGDGELPETSSLLNTGLHVGQIESQSENLEFGR